MKFLARLWRLIIGRRKEPAVVVPSTPPAQPRPRRPRLKRCMYKDKVMYTRDQAQFKRDQMMRKYTKLNLRIYCCEYCSAWHLTHHRRYGW